MLSSLDSEYIIKYYDSFLERVRMGRMPGCSCGLQRPCRPCMRAWASHAQGKLYIITEYASNGNLHDYIKKQKQKLPEDLIWKLFTQVLMVCMGIRLSGLLHLALNA